MPPHFSPSPPGALGSLGLLSLPSPVSQDRGSLGAGGLGRSVGNRLGESPGSTAGAPARRIARHRAPPGRATSWSARGVFAGSRGCPDGGARGPATEETEGKSWPWHAPAAPRCQQGEGGGGGPGRNPCSARAFESPAQGPAIAPRGHRPRLPRGRGNAQNLSLYPGPAGRPKGPKEGLAGATGRLQDAARGVDLRGGEGSPGVSGRLPPQRPSGAPPGSPRACGIRAVFISQARGALELSTGGRPAWAQANLRVVGALAAGAALCGCGAGFKSMIPVFSSWLMQAALNDTQRRTL